MLLAHASVGLLANRIFQKDIYKNLSIKEIFFFDLLVIIFSILPDFDFFYLIAINNNVLSHHKLVTHTPIFWILFSIFIYFILKLLSKNTHRMISFFIKENAKRIAYTILIGTLFHLFSDMIQSEIMLLYPILSYGFTILGNTLSDRIFYPLLHPMFILEIVIIIYSIYMLQKQYLNENQKGFLTIKTRQFLKYFFIVVSILILTLTTILHTQTYNFKNRRVDENNFIIHDIDDDNIPDYLDTDTDNNGVNNLLDSRGNKELIIAKAIEVSSSGKITSNNMVTYYLGGIDNSRLIDITYLTANLPIYQILNNYKNTDKNGYRIKKSQEYNEVLFKYLSDYSLLAQTNYLSNLQQGDLIFFYTKDDTQRYIGILLENNEISTVLKDDKRLKIHSTDIINFEKELYLFR